MESFHGAVNSPNDALLLFEACRLNMLKRVQRRLSESERMAYVRSGAVFIWDEEESGIKRWTDGKHWSPSRINGSFLIYREVEARKTTIPGVTEEKIEYVIKEGGLTKKAISITTSNGRKQHLVSYYLRTDHNRSLLEAPTDMPMFSDVVISTDIYPEFTPDSGAVSITSSRSSIASYTPSVASSQTGEYVRPNYVPVPKSKPAKPARDASPYRQDAAQTKRQFELDHPRPSQDSGKHMSIHSMNSMDDGRSFRSYDNHSIRSYDNYSVRSFDAQSVRSYHSHDEPWNPPRTEGMDNSHQGFQVVVPPPQPRESHYDQNKHPIFHQNMASSSRVSPTSLHRSPSILSSVSAMTSPPEFQNSQYGSRGHTSPHRTPSVRSLPIGLVEGAVGASKRELVLPVPKPSSVHHFPSQSNMIASNGDKSPMFLAHMNWTPGKDYRRGGGSLEGVSRLGLSSAPTNPDHEPQHAHDGPSPMDWEPGEQR
ncbi:Gti1/Pac2 family-domain-containing protein [Powellomyces hirtus]|nr:Gti1/Pac2 family-domain-containing protein [Powellomyces hirtus]